MTFRAPSKLYFYDLTDDTFLEYFYSHKKHRDCYCYRDEWGDEINVEYYQIFSKNNIPGEEFLDNKEEVFFSKKETCERFRSIYLQFCLSKIQIKIMKLASTAREYSDRLEAME